MGKPAEPKVEIDDLVGEVKMQTDMHRSYYNRETGELSDCKKRFAEIAKRWCEEHDLGYVEGG